MTAKVPPDEAVAWMRERGYEPLTDYPGGARPWLVVHVACGREVTPRLNNLRHGQGGCVECGKQQSAASRRTDPEAAAAHMRELGFEPLVPFPGIRTAWPSRHVACGREVAPNLNNLRSGQGGCETCGQAARALSSRVDQESAAADMRAADLEPLEPYRTALAPWLCRHLPCGQQVTPTLNYVRQHGRPACPTCSDAMRRYTAPALIYVVSTEEAHKVGVGGQDGARLKQHQREGWRVDRTMLFPVGSDAYAVERAVLRHLREDLGLPPFAAPVDMPQHGWTETVDREAITADDLWRLVEEAAIALRCADGAQLALFDAPADDPWQDKPRGICRFPGCQQPVAEHRSKGRVAYCPDPEHNSRTAQQQRRQSRPAKPRPTPLRGAVARGRVTPGG